MLFSSHLACTLTQNNIFYNFKSRLELEIPIINDFDPEKDEHFEVELFDATSGARVGNINRMAVTIANDDGN